ncbi:MAG: hypothetical protein IPK22_26190 [Verrucomicrobiaceae bacterium]|nr:hypothetical protein [Verrucomicrobiaceae bacterium]
MKPISLYLLLLAGTTLGQPAATHENQPPPSPPCSPRSSSPARDCRRALPLSAQSVDLDTAKAGGTDGASMLANTPGAAILRNGSQTGIMQLHGLSGDRVKISVDGATHLTRVSNRMDPPLHYASRGSMDTLAVMAGITPVSQGRGQHRWHRHRALARASLCHRRAAVHRLRGDGQPLPQQQ